MALKAGYVGIKRNLMKQLSDKFNKLDVIIPSGASAEDPLALNSEIADIWDANSITGVHNILPIKLADVKTINTTGTWTGNTYRHNGVDFACAADGEYLTSVTASRAEASSSTASFYLVASYEFKKDVKYLLNGSPDLETDQVWLGVYRTTSPAGYEHNSYNGNDSDIISYEEDTSRAIRIRIGSSVSVENGVFKPMIRYAADTNNIYQFPAFTNQLLTNDVINLMNTTNSIITAATGAADFEAFKTAMEAITPVTRSVQPLQAETREVEPEAEPETKTTKRSTKKTTE